ncbi:hypothetical protein [Methylobacterium sp. J-068]|uniref:hypothetical protein n=1 Tax=Methylobacterium sp. J-068 TaxID=2836649 RepID=UPI001FB8CAB0|nr:hypothetical protein [Methylobacterium sp. J-068]MCJ2034265.1 hypothetical protein [Methylobacterium sp. J-068]
MAGLFASGRIIDAILVLVALEALVLILWRRRDGLPLPLVCNLTSGAALMLALRAALTGADWTAIAGCLAVSGLAHGMEMTLRLGGLAAPGRPAPARPEPMPLDPHG